MEVMRSMNIVFSNGLPVPSEKVSLPAVRNPAPLRSKSPVDQRGAKPNRNPSRSEVSSITPVLGQSLDGGYTSQRESAQLPDSAMEIYLPQRTVGPFVETPTSLKKISPTDSGIELSPVSPTKINPKIRSMYTGNKRETEDPDFSMNPDPVPFQPSNFMSSTMMKKVPVSRRHLDTFNSVEFSSLGKRGVMLHTDRYQWDLARALDGDAEMRYMDRLLSLYSDKSLNVSQRERLQAELEYMERLRGIKRRREVLPHRAQLDLLMGGKKIEFTERFDIQREINKLKSLILPQHAKDLFHGRGFVLPEDHHSLKPRRTLPPDIDLDDDLGSPFSADRYAFNAETGRVVPKWQKQSEPGPGGLPRINNKGYLLGHGAPILLSREKRTVESIKARLRIPTKNFRAQKGEPIPVKTPNPFTADMDDTWTPYVTRQSTMMSPLPRSSSKSPMMPYSPRRQRHRDRQSAPQPAYMTRSKTNVPSSHKQATGRSLTAIPAKKSTRPTGTAPVKHQTREIKIPVSARDETELEETTPAVPKPTPTTANSAIAEEDGPFDVLDEWPEIEELGDQPEDASGRPAKSQRSASRSSMQSPHKAATPNPLKGVPLENSLTDDQQQELKRTFSRLDTDGDGHLMFSQLKTQLPKQFSQPQERYIKQVYEITSSSTFFGVDEFMTMSYLTNIVTDLTGPALEAYNKIDLHEIGKSILEYAELFQSVDRLHKGKISLDSLKDILTTVCTQNLKSSTDVWPQVEDALSLSEAGHISKVEFLANLPLFEILCKGK